MDLKIHGIQMKSFHFLEMNKIKDEDKERIFKREDSIELEIKEKKSDNTEEESLELLIIPQMTVKFTFDERYYYLGDISGHISVYNMTEEEFNDEDVQMEFIERIITAFTKKFDMFIGLFSQEVYSGTRMPERNQIEILKNKNKN